MKQRYEDYMETEVWIKAYRGINEEGEADEEEMEEGEDEKGEDDEEEEEWNRKRGMS